MALARTFLGHRKGPAAKRAKLMRLDAHYADQLERAAAAVTAAAEKAEGRGGGRGVTQGALDREDGVNLHWLGDILHAFESAHDIDATIPHLVAISTRRLLGKRSRKKAALPASGEPVPGGPAKG